MILGSLLGAVGCSDDSVGSGTCEVGEPGCELVCVKENYGTCPDSPPDSNPDCDGKECPPPDDCKTNPDACEPPPPPPGCTYTLGFWKHQCVEGTFPIWAISIGETTYLAEGEGGYCDILWSEVTGDATIILAHQYFAAVLNAANGASTDELDSMNVMGEALAFLEQYGIGTGVDPNSPEGQAMVALADVLALYNEGYVGPGHCTDEVSYEPDPIVVPL